MALVLLPCDLPTWPTLQRHLNALKSANDEVSLEEGLLKIYNLCNVSLDPDDENPDQTIFKGLLDFLSTVLSNAERQRFFSVQLPCIVDFALKLKILKPVKGLQYSLQQQGERFRLDRGLVASLLAHCFLCTFPRRTSKTHPTLQDFTFAQFFVHLHRKSQRAKLRGVLHYFDRLCETEPRGSVTFCRQVMSSREWCTLEDWLSCDRPLCPLLVRSEGRIEHGESSAVHVCFASCKPGGSVLTDGASQECVEFVTHPELLALLPFAESLEDNEALLAHGVQCFSLIHDLKNKAVFDPGAKLHAPRDAEGNLDTKICCIDAEDYSDLPIKQYEEDDVLRELNKAYTGFQQNGRQQRLPPVGASRGSSPTLHESRCNDSNKEDFSDWTRSTTLVASSNDVSRSSSITGPKSPETIPESPKPKIRPSIPAVLRKREKIDGNCEHPPEPSALLFGGGRKGPLTLTSPTCLKQLHVDAADRKRPSLGEISRYGSVYTSCNSEGSSDEFKSANTSIEDEHKGNSVSEEERGMDALSQRYRELQTELSESNGTHRSGSGGFALDNFGEEDSFSGDGLEKEREWLQQFRERRGRSRSHRDSSKYSFSSEFSSELDEMYEQFSHWLDDPKGKELDARDLAVFRFAHSLLKRALSDSFACVAMNIENISQDTRMSDIKLSSSPQTSKPVDKIQPRSLSLVDNTSDERLALQLAKEIVERDSWVSGERGKKARSVSQDFESADEEDSEPSISKHLSCQLVSIVMEQSLTEVEVELQVAHRRNARNNESTRGERLTNTLRNQDSVAWEYHQNPSCAFKIQLRKEPNRGVGRSQPLANDSSLLTNEANNNSPKTQQGSAERVVLLDRCTEDPEDDRTPTPTMIQKPLNPTPPRTRRGSWIFKKSRERHQKSRDTPKQRARSNSVPAVMELADLRLWQNWKPSIPDIVVSAEEGDDECFPRVSNQRRHRSFDEIRLKESSESLLSDDVVEGFSWTLAETIIEEIFRDLRSTATKSCHLEIPSKTTKTYRKGILKNTSNDSLYRSNSGSLDHEGSRFFDAQDQISQWAQRSTSMPSLRAIDESDTSPNSNQNSSEDEDTSKLVHNSDTTDGPRPILTGNWGCGSRCGDPQLKAMLQWMAASKAGAPCVIYYTCGVSKVVQLDIVCRVILDRHWSVGDLARAILRYCRSKLDPSRLAEDFESCAQSILLRADSTLSSASTGDSRRWHGSVAASDHSLFDEILGQLPFKQTEL